MRPLVAPLRGTQARARADRRAVGPGRCRRGGAGNARAIPNAAAPAAAPGHGARIAPL
jgi:hypothetical protein